MSKIKKIMLITNLFWNISKYFGIFQILPSELSELSSAFLLVADPAATGDAAYERRICDGTTGTTTTGDGGITFWAVEAVWAAWAAWASK